MSALTVTDLTVDYRQRGGSRFRAVDALSFALEPGQTLALVGESGSGKSTVVRTLSRFVKPSAGEILLRGVDAADGVERGLPRGRRAKRKAYHKTMQLVFQDPFASLNPMHTVAHHLRRPLLLHGGHRRGPKLEAAVLDLLRSVNLTPAEDVARKHPHELSGGQRQRVAIARALATDPKVLLADEPVSMLDVSIRLEILNLLDRLKQDRDLALLYVTHDLATARHFSSQIMVMYRGEVVERGPSDQVILHPAHPYTRMLAAAAPDPTVSRAALAEARAQRAALRDTRAAEHRESVLDQGCRFRSRCPFAMPVCATRPPDLPAVKGSVPGAGAGGAGHAARCWLLDESAAAAPAADSAD
ncbi:ABC transporter ATP-binding protein [Actinocrinis puniceicyclus]|uniref:ABC transporter ATP-binding protein n=1 Tax=Actinocrinis puniceicyclus TaxID=977794 RepID=A0A8J7WLF2_9ACTN|nr:ABC transporter ATP-binding protein [Actinocrinis puniceicyclus]MBS2961934.1 ABC transporter ATP-binding protein [Actinocrinis puniceicyclus]